MTQSFLHEHDEQCAPDCPRPGSWGEGDQAPPEPEQETTALCFRCVTGTCGHHEQLTPVRSGGIPLHSVPAITARQGTLLCLDCAMAVRSQ